MPIAAESRLSMSMSVLHLSPAMLSPDGYIHAATRKCVVTPSIFAFVLDDKVVSIIQATDEIGIKLVGRGLKPEGV